VESIRPCSAASTNPDSAAGCTTNTVTGGNTGSFAEPTAGTSITANTAPSTAFVVVIIFIAFHLVVAGSSFTVNPASRYHEIASTVYNCKNSDH
jgi:hypothetical protein